MDLHKFNLKINALGRFSMSPWKGTKYKIINKNVKNILKMLRLTMQKEIQFKPM